jgi:hypothetical protein
MAGVVVLFCTLAANRFLGERNYKLLSPEDKVKLVDQFSAHRSLATYIPLGIMGVVILVGRSDPGVFRWLFPIAVSVVLFVSIALQAVVLRRLAALELPEDFVSRFRFQSIAVQSGNVIALSLFAYGVVGAT